MSNDSGKMSFNKKQLYFLMELTGEVAPKQAIEAFAMALIAEKVDVALMQQYLVILMEKFEAPA